MTDDADVVDDLLLMWMRRMVLTYEALTPIRYETRYDMRHTDTTFLEKLGHNTVGIQPLIN